MIHVVIDECHLFLNPSRTKREDLGPPPLEGCLRRQRKYGVAIWVISQTVCDLPSSVRANLGTVVALTLSNLRCAQLVAGSMGLSREQADLVPTLPTRHAVVRSHALDEPVAIRVADLPELQAPDRARLEREMREILSRLPCTGTGQQDGTASAGYLSSARERAATGRAGRGPGRPAPGDAWGGAGGRAAQPHGGAAGSPGRGDGSPGAGGEAPIELGHAGHLGNGAPAGDTGTSAETGASAASGTKPGTGNGTGAGPGGAGAGVRELLAPATGGGPSLAAVNYLVEIDRPKFHCLPATWLDRELGLALSKGHALRGELLGAGLIELIKVKTGQRGADVTYPRVTAEGQTMLKRMGVAPHPVRGKAGPIGQFWSHAVARHVAREVQGARPEIEGTAGEGKGGTGGPGKAADVAVELPPGSGRWTAYEVQMSPGHVAQNAVKDVLAGFDHLVVCALTEDDLRALRKRLTRELEPGVGEGLTGRIEFRRLAGFLR